MAVLVYVLPLAYTTIRIRWPQSWLVHTISHLSDAPTGHIFDRLISELTPDSINKLNAIRTILSIAIAGALTLLTVCLRLFTKHTIARRLINAEPFGEEQAQALSKALLVDRRELQFSLVPGHSPVGTYGGPRSLINLGDAKLTLQPNVQKQLVAFSTQRKSSFRFGNRDAESIADSVLMLTGEPGAGKSVIAQEIQASLGTGIKDGRHSYLPLILFARDFHADILRVANLDHSSQIQTLVLKSYETRMSRSHADRDLRHLYDVLSSDWDTLNLLIMIDGLDEIPQRSEYEFINRTLSAQIKQDLARPRKTVHRYIVTCRIDEDLDFFADAQQLRLQGLDERQRHAFWHSLIRRNASPTKVEEFEQLLNSARLSPSHVFRRNPYFLALLVAEITQEDSTLKQQIIDFDYLMRRYLARESTRYHVSAREGTRLSREELEHSLAELERVARLSLQYLAFTFIQSRLPNALYDEMTLSPSLLQGFAHELHALESVAIGGDVPGQWQQLRILLARLASARRGPMLASETLRYTSALHENDLRLLYLLSGEIKERHKVSSTTLWQSLGSIPSQGWMECEEWYKELIDSISTLLGTRQWSKLDQLSILIFVRGIAAAHVLRVLTVVAPPKTAIGVRFRHRRLAEYYAACYVVENWDDAKLILTAMPWMGPVLNIASAVEGSRCLVLNWLTMKLGACRLEGWRTWRRWLEVAVEAAHFSVPGTAYEHGFWKLVSEIAEVLNGDVSRADESGGHLGAVTRLAGLRAVTRLGRLRPLLHSPMPIPDAIPQRDCLSSLLML